MVVLVVLRRDIEDEGSKVDDGAAVVCLPAWKKTV